MLLHEDEGAGRPTSQLTLDSLLFSYGDKVDMNNPLVADLRQSSTWLSDDCLSGLILQILPLDRKVQILLPNLLVSDLVWFPSNLAVLLGSLP